MLGLPKTTEMSKQLPKKAIYTKFQMNTAAKEKIDADISRITRAKGKLITIANVRFWNNLFKGTSHIYYMLLGYIKKNHTVI